MRNLSLWQAVAFAFELGAALAAGVFLGLGAGYLVDSRLGGNAPVFTILGSLVGLGAGVYACARLVQFLTPPAKE